MDARRPDGVDSSLCGDAHRAARPLRGQASFTAHHYHACAHQLRVGRGHGGWGALLLPALLVLTSCSIGSPVASPTPTPTATVQPTATPREQPTPLATLLDPPPTNCPLSPPLQTLSFAQFGGFTRGVTLYGAPPAWMADFDPAPVLHLEEPLGYRPYPGEKIIWEVGPNYTLSQPVTAQVTNLETGALAWWDTGTGNGPTPYTSHTLVLDQSQPSYHGNSGTPSEPNWQEWGSGLYILQAGCYSLVVRWPGGQWQTNFAAGR